MAFNDQWRSISNRIRGLIKAGGLHARLLAAGTDSYGRPQRLREHCEEILFSLKKFGEDYRDTLPIPAITAIRDFSEKNEGLITDTSGTADLRNDRVGAALVLLAAFEANLTFILSDTQEGIRAHSERAFSHLQRSIVADPDIRQKWDTAFNSGEVACEKLGSLHLLSHGIYGFKVNATGERTDLVFQDLVSSRAEDYRFSDGVVLTEWKVARTKNEAEKKLSEAKAQAKLYAQGVLGGIELTGYRYLIVVSKDYVPIPADEVEAETTYRHINIAVAPATPSVTSKRKL